MESAKLNTADIPTTDMTPAEHFVPHQPAKPALPPLTHDNTLDQLITPSHNRNLTIDELRYNQRIINEYQYAQERLRQARQAEARRKEMQELNNPTPDTRSLTDHNPPPSAPTPKPIKPKQTKTTKPKKVDSNPMKGVL